MDLHQRGVIFNLNDINIKIVKKVISIKKICMISKPSPTLGRSPLHGAGGGLFGHYNESNYISEVQKKLDSIGCEWVIVADDTEGDIEKIIAQGTMLIVCAPGLRFQFYSNGFDKKRIIYLSAMEYASDNASPLIKKLNEIGNQK
ncbi:nitrogen fixation protein NifS [Pantoea sp. Eser]|nr:nitrogen fixation protein NifS [Pantoea sp. Eser]